MADTTDTPLIDKVAIVTGAGGGLGAAHAKFLASQGASVVVNDVGPGGADIVAEIEASGGNAALNSGSVASWDDTEGMVDQAIETFGDLHIVVNNEGITRDTMSFNMSEQDFDDVVAVHLKGHFALSRHAGVYFRAQSKAGVEVGRRLIHTTSESGIWGTVGQTNYGSAKGGILTMAIAFAMELGRVGVTSNVIAPRARTPMTANQQFHQREEIPEGGFDKWAPENISPLVGWLASDAAADVSGQVFVVSGGDIHSLTGWKYNAGISRDSAWTIAEIEEHRGELFGDRPTGIPPWDTPAK